MNLRKASALLATAALALTLSGGVMAQGVGTTITLDDGEGCSASLSGATIDFGTFTWDGDTNEYIGNESSGSFTVSATSGSYDATNGCTVELTAGALENQDKSVVIPDAVTLTEAGDTTNTGNPIDVTVTPGTSKTVNASLSSGFMTSMHTYAPDSYSGAITITGEASSG